MIVNDKFHCITNNLHVETDYFLTLADLSAELLEDGKTLLQFKFRLIFTEGDGHSFT